MTSYIAPFTTRTFVDRTDAHSFFIATGWECLHNSLYRRDDGKVADVRMYKGELIARIFN